MVVKNSVFSRRGKVLRLINTVATVIVAYVQPLIDLNMFLKMYYSRSA